MYIVVYVYIKPRLRSHMWFNLFMESRSHIYRFSILLKYKDGQMFNLRYCIFFYLAMQAKRIQIIKEPL